jgi:hypothetical protein
VAAIPDKDIVGAAIIPQIHEGRLEDARGRIVSTDGVGAALEDPDPAVGVDHMIGLLGDRLDLWRDLERG